ncbi:magnesium transporter CorA family protein [Streptococcus halichoeri]|uniref:magnesium transporter CorA family protein n=1 Tax=Streptococcus halichoeri TaxID=254785 RepID=UPI001C8D2E70|nr:magnesium transporter CorA family protein [Streptococcus halichoeri]
MSRNQNALRIINLAELSQDEKNQLISKQLVTKEILAYAQDRHEASFTEKNEAFLTVVYQVLEQAVVPFHIGDIPKFHPLTFVLNAECLVLLTTPLTHSMSVLMAEQIDQTQSPRHMLYQLLTLFTKQYFALMDDITQHRDHLIKDLRKRPNKHNLAVLANLQSGSVYLLMGSKQNSEMLNDLKALSQDDDDLEVEKEQLTDALIEARQLSNMCSLHTRILEQLASSYNNVLSNRLNDNVTVLTIISVGLAIISAVTSFYGMNVKLPFAKIDVVWLLILLITSLFALIAMVAMRRFVNHDHDDRWNR